MGVFDFFKPKQKGISEPKEEIVTETKSSFPYLEVTSGMYWPIMSKTWDGEKTPGELGIVVKNIPDYQRLRLRALDAFIKTDIVKIISQKKFDWIVGSGLKLQTEPNKTVLESEGIKHDFSTFQNLAEARFFIYANSVHCDFSKQKNLHQLANDFYKGKYLMGDCLCIARFSKNGPNVQFVSAEHIVNPTELQYFEDAKNAGNYVEHGIEYNASGEHVAYYVCVKSEGFTSEVQRIPAKGSTTGRTMAWMIYGARISPDHKRGVPEISQVLEKVNKLDRYTEASVSKAEQAANLIYAIAHKEFSTGENPLTEMMNKKLGVAGSEILDGYRLADGIANEIKQTTSNMAINLPPGASLENFSTDIETNYEQFINPNFNFIAAAIGVPPEVAMQKYSSNYSASRAAINGWGYMVDIDRADFSNQFYKPFYKLWLEFEILNNKIEAPGYILALKSGNFMVTESYSNCRFIGKNMPHIDPLKEIKAIREMLGDDMTPLITREQATESLNMGEWNENYTKNLEEGKIIEVPKEKTEPTNNIEDEQL